MSEPLPLIPAALADRMVGLAQREALWRGILTGAVSVLLLALILLAVFLWPARARAQNIPDEAYRFKRDIVRAGQHVWGLDAPTATLAAQIHQESRFRINARSPAGASGISQFMPSTSDWIAATYPHELSGDRTTAEWGILAMSRYMKHLWDRTSGVDDCERMAFAQAGYNGGERWVRKRKAMSDTPEVCLFSTCTINPGITAANQRENEGYPKRILLTLEPIYIAAGFGPGACSR